MIIRMTALMGTLGLLVAGGVRSARTEKAQASAPPESTIASVMDAQLSALEGPFVAAADAMPAAKYSFVPTGGEFAGVRSFALEVKHVATANFVFYSAILGEPLPKGISLSGATNGPEDIRTKQQIVKYLKDSFALGHRAFSTLTSRNAALPLAPSPVPSMSTRLALAAWSCAHAWDHYGQIVEYLRMNGIVPPASAGQPPANPMAKP